MQSGRTKTRRWTHAGWATAVVLVLSASVAVGQADSSEAARSVPSPYTAFDVDADDPSPLAPDISVLQVRNGPSLVDLRFRIRVHDAPADSLDAWFSLDLAGSTLLADYSVKVDLDSRRVVVARLHPTAGQTCVSSDVAALGTNRWGEGFSARFSYGCIGGRRTFRTAMSLNFWGLPCCDRAPNTGWTPFISPT